MAQLKRLAFLGAAWAVIFKVFFQPSATPLPPPVEWDKCFLRDPNECVSKKKLEHVVQPAALNIPDEQLEDLKVRLSMRKPIHGGILNETDPWENGMNPLYLEEVLAYWHTQYDWRMEEAYINRELSPHTTVIDGLDIFFLHVAPKSSKDQQQPPSIPMLLLHGWPGSVIEFKYFVQTMHRKNPNYEFIVPSLPGYGFSSAAQIPGMNPCQMAVVMHKLMTVSLKLDQFFVQGGDWGSMIAHCLAALSPDHVIATHVNMPLASHKLWHIPYVYFIETDQRERSKLLPLSKLASRVFYTLPYFFQQSTRPNSVGIGMQDSPVATAAWILDKFYLWTDPQSDISKDDLITNLMFYWLTGSSTTAATLYKEFFWSDTSSQQIAFLFQGTFHPRIALSDFPYEIAPPPEVVLRSRYDNILRLDKEDRGGHFAALEQPESLARHVHDMVEKVTAADAAASSAK